MAVKFTPDGFHSLTPCVRVKNLEKFIQFLKQAFDGNTNAKELRNVKKKMELLGVLKYLQVTLF